MVFGAAAETGSAWCIRAHTGAVFLEVAMKRAELAGRLHLSTIGSDSRQVAMQYGLGLEIADFCTAVNLDQNVAAHRMAVRKEMEGIGSFWLHAPFAELSPASIDPKVRGVTILRYRQAMEMAASLGISRLVIHSGFIPLVYFPEWFVEQSVLFWREFLEETPEGITIALENVMEPGPEMLVEIVQQVQDRRLGLCLDVGHANSLVSKTPVVDWVAPMAPYLRHVHLHNNEGDADLHQCLGTGTAPMEAVLDRILASCPQATFTIENPCCAPSVAWLRAHGYLVDQ